MISKTKKGGVISKVLDLVTMQGWGSSKLPGGFREQKTQKGEYRKYNHEKIKHQAKRIVWGRGSEKRNSGAVTRAGTGMVVVLVL